ncbi:hypothetical protein ACFO26_08005 [Lactococcus nasutitermitis]|uniref:Uncharacterized protein n=1 Tax=Lactococcus nasutitermitis TaxID=1652957 RepID=A0ABV9JFW3_9LACT|nr:hypothetical protein [Lactococcus nasutitermitis]
MYNYQADFEEMFHKVKPIIIKSMSHVKIHFWKDNDYLKEGRVVLLKLLQIEYPKENLLIHFKLKYHQHLMNELRHFNSQNRMQSCMTYTLFALDTQERENKRNSDDDSEPMNGNYPLPV